jgi:hypothetical protein
MSDQTVSELRIGDVMRISVALIKQIEEEHGGQSPRVIVKEIRVEADGTRILVLSRLEDPS